MKIFPIAPAVVLALACLQVQPVSAAELTAYLNVQSSQGGGVYRDQITNSTTASGLSFEDSTANSAGSTTVSYGNLRVVQGARYFLPSSGNDGFSGETHTRCSWSDTFTINSVALDGQVGYFKPTLRYMTSLQGFLASDGNVSGSIIAVGLTVTLANQPYNLFTEHDVGVINSGSFLNLNVDAGDLAASNGVANMELQFTFGQPIAIAANIYGVAYGTGGNGTYFRGSQMGFGKLRWLGGHVYDDTKTNEVINFSTTSESGTSWVAAQGGTVPAPQISGTVATNGTNVVLNGSGGQFGDAIVLLTSTNVAAPVANWIRLETNFVDFAGGVSFTNTVINRGEPQRYFRFETQ
jgi:hypothetical protein